MGSLRVRHDWTTSLSLFTFRHWRRKWQPTPVFLPGESQGWGSLVGCCLWGRIESDTTEATYPKAYVRNLEKWYRWPYLFSLDTLHGLWHPSFPSRDWTWAAAMKVSSPNHWLLSHFSRVQPLNTQTNPHLISMCLWARLLSSLWPSPSRPFPECISVIFFLWSFLVDRENGR